MRYKLIGYRPILDAMKSLAMECNGGLNVDIEVNNLVSDTTAETIITYFY